MTLKVALLMNFVAPYRVPLFQSVRAQLGEFRIFVSTAMEPDRPWRPDWSGLDVVVQKTLTKPARHRHNGFEQQLYIHFPYDTLPQLFRYSPDVTISGELGLRSLQAALYRRLRRDSRLIIWATLSEYTETGWGVVRRTLRRFILSAADGVIVNGASGARYIAGLDPRVAVFVMNQPVDVPRFAALPLERTAGPARRLIYSGRLIGQKGVVEFQRAVAEWARARASARIEIIWLGDGELRSDLETETVPDNVGQRFLGYASYDALPDLYGSSDILVLPSKFDEWGLVVNEAMASGLPVLGSRYSQAVEEMVVDGVTGWTFDPLRPETVATALDRIFATSDEALMAMRAAARARASEITPDSAAACMVSAIAAVASPASQTVTRKVTA